MDGGAVKFQVVIRRGGELLEGNQWWSWKGEGDEIMWCYFGVHRSYAGSGWRREGGDMAVLQ